MTKSNPGNLTTKPAAVLVTASGLTAALLQFADTNRSDRIAHGGASVISASGPLLPSGSIRFMAIDRLGTVWFRVVDRVGGRDRVISLDSGGRRRTFGGLRAVVETSRALVTTIGTLPDFWAVDARGNVWVGPAYHDGGEWITVAEDHAYPGGAMNYEERVVVDDSGNAWVPYHALGDCSLGGACDDSGFAGFSVDGDLIREVSVDVPAELNGINAPAVRFEAFGDGTFAAVGTKSVFLLPATASRVLPGLGVDPETGERNAGFVSASAVRPDGDVAMFTWIEPLATDPRPVVAEVAGSRSTWQSNDLGASPLFRDDARGRFLAAAAYAPDGTLWAASTAGELAARSAGRWTQHFTQANSPMGDQVTDLAVDAGGAVWVATVRGVRVFKDGVWRTSMTLHLPRLDKACGWLHPCLPGGSP